MIDRLLDLVGRPSFGLIWNCTLDIPRGLPPQLQVLLLSLLLPSAGRRLRLPLHCCFACDRLPVLPPAARLPLEVDRVQLRYAIWRHAHGRQRGMGKVRSVVSPLPLHPRRQRRLARSARAVHVAVPRLLVEGAQVLEVLVPHRLLRVPHEAGLLQLPLPVVGEGVAGAALLLVVEAALPLDPSGEDLVWLVGAGDVAVSECVLEGEEVVEVSLPPLGLVHHGWLWPWCWFCLHDMSMCMVNSMMNMMFL
mmetsp:Transcript_16649/g.46628  ORF Transcript_16649/g.46628 Transcript_16649/m.46628 type:complete len:250 (+) Transcript_16649:428-1177(+)